MLRDIYRVNTGAVSIVNNHGVKIKADYLKTYYCIPVRNARQKIVAFNELLTGIPLVKRVYEKNECYDNDYKDIYYPYNYGKSNQVVQVGDVDVEIDQDYDDKELQEYLHHNKENLENLSDSIKTLEIRAIEQTCDGYASCQTMEYYNKKLYLCPLDDDYIIVAPYNIFGTHIGFKELQTERKVIKRDDEPISDYLIHLNRQLMNPEITPINLSILATRKLTVEEFKSYMDLTPEEVEAKIANYLAKKSREREINRQQLIKH